MYVITDLQQIYNFLIELKLTYRLKLFLCITEITIFLNVIMVRINSKYLSVKMW